MTMINKCCILVCNEMLDKVIFKRALNDVSPETICITVADPAEALYVIAREKLTPDFIFLELDMPEMNASEFLRAIKNIEELRGVHVIVHATSPQPNKIIEIKELGAFAIYLRPYEYYGVCNMLSLYLSPDMVLSQQN